MSNLHSVQPGTLPNRLAIFGRNARVLTMLTIAATAAFGQTATNINADVNNDGYVDQTDINLITAGLGTKPLGLTDPRDVNKDGAINIMDVRLASLRCTLPGCAIPTRVSMTQNQTSLNIAVGEFAQIYTSLSYIGGDTTSRSLPINQTLSPNNGVSVSNLPLSATFSGTSTQNFAQTVEGVKLGSYTLTTSTQATPTSPVVMSTVKINVVPIAPPPPSLSELGASPGAVPAGVPTTVTITTRASNYPTPPTSLTLKGQGLTISVPMNDSGVAGDITAGDGVYSAQITPTIVSGSCQSFQATDGTVVSPVFSLCATALPTTNNRPNVNNSFGDTNGQPSAIKDEILVTFTPRTLESQIQALAASIPATIVGGFPSTHTYQFRLNTPPATLAALQAIVSALRLQPFVVSADPNYIVKSSAQIATPPAGSVFAVTPPSGPLAPDWALQAIRANEAWNVSIGGCLALQNIGVTTFTVGKPLRLYLTSCGNPTIAILDTGVGTGSYPGHNYSGDGGASTETSDGNGHGTAVASLITTVNSAINSSDAGYRQGLLWPGTGTGSITWVDKVFDNSGNGTTDTLVAGLTDAIAQKVNIINLSLESVFSTTVNGLITTAYNNGINTVGAAGNDDKDACSYSPQFMGSVAQPMISVGASDINNNEANSYSNAGICVSLLAPGGVFALNTPPGIKLDTSSGTSFSAPLVTGAVALLLGAAENLTPAQVKARVIATANPIAGTGDPTSPATILDAMELVFNGSFEDPNLSYSNQPLWTTTGTVNSITNLPGVTCPVPVTIIPKSGVLPPPAAKAPTCPADRSRMARLSIGGTADTTTSATLTSPPLLSPNKFFPTTRLFPAAPNVIGFNLSYALLAPAGLPSTYAETLTISLTTQTLGTGTIVLATIPVTPASYTAATGVNLPGSAAGNSTIVWSGWQNVTLYTNALSTFDAYNLVFTLSGPSTCCGGYNTVALVDGIKFVNYETTSLLSYDNYNPNPSSATPYSWTSAGSVGNASNIQTIYESNPEGGTDYMQLSIGDQNDLPSAVLNTPTVATPYSKTTKISFNYGLMTPKGAAVSAYNEKLTVTLNTDKGVTNLATIPVNPAAYTTATLENLPLSTGAGPGVFSGFIPLSFTVDTTAFNFYNLVFTLSGTPNAQGTYGGIETLALIDNVVVK